MLSAVDEKFYWNAWQGVACSPTGIAMSLPSELAVLPSKTIDACYTHFNVVSSGITEPNLTKLINNAEKLLPINLLNRNCDIAIHYGTPVSRMKVGPQIVAESWQKLHTLFSYFPGLLDISSSHRRC